MVSKSDLDLATLYINHLLCRSAGQSATAMVQLSVLVLSSLVLAVTLARYQKRTDRPGSDLPNMPIRLDEGSSPDDCEALCANRPACQAWTYETCGPRAQSCWLKYEAKKTVRNNCKASNQFLLLTSYK